jgi:hypothetical protein
MASPQKGDPSLDAGQAGEEIRHLLGDSSLGRILVASSGKDPHYRQQVDAALGLLLARPA